MPVVEKLEIVSGVFYTPKPDHRDRTPGKSQWVISQQAEVDCFTHASRSGWLSHLAGWGLHFADEGLDYLGIARDHLTQLFVAKFVTAASSNEWHGYPADHQRNLSDIPETRVLRNWLNAGILPAAKIRKLSKGQLCSL